MKSPNLGRNAKTRFYRMKCPDYINIQNIIETFLKRMNNNENQSVKKKRLKILDLGP